MKTNEIKKGMKIKVTNLGTPVTGIMMDNLKGDTRLVEVKGSEVGMFDEMGSVYSHDIALVEVEEKWITVEHTEKQIKLKRKVAEFGF
mgnify:CR=1 FL=1